MGSRGGEGIPIFFRLMVNGSVSSLCSRHVGNVACGTGDEDYFATLSQTSHGFMVLNGLWRHQYT